MISSMVGRINQILEGVVCDDHARIIFRSSSTVGIRMAVPMADHVILRHSAFRAELATGGNRKTNDGVENALKEIIYQKTSVNRHNGRIADFPCSDLTAHVR